ncbi:MAG: universal stress protein [Methanomicrobiales archaeon]
MEDVPDISTILVAFDGSDQSERALRTALVIARALNARLHSVFVIKPGKGIPRVGPLSVRFGGADGGIQAVSRMYRDEGLRMEKRIADIARDVSVPVRTSTRIGDPREEILDLARTIGADLIVIGSRGRGGMAELLLGSVSSHVVKQSSISTLVVR